MSKVVSVRVSDETKKKMEKREEVNWSEFIRRAIKQFLEEGEGEESADGSTEMERKDLEEIKRKIKRRIAEKHGIEIKNI